MVRVLLVEDEAPKRQKLLSRLSDNIKDVAVTEAHSVTSAIKCLRTMSFELVLLDMSLPTFDVGPGEPGGRGLGSGGIEVLRSMDRLRLEIPVIVVTAFEAFSNGGRSVSLDTMSKDLEKMHPNTFRGLVLYNSLFSTWSLQLKELIKKAVEAS